MHILHLNQRNQILFQYLRDKKKERKKGTQKKGGENSPISPPLDPPLSFKRDGNGFQVYPRLKHASEIGGLWWKLSGTFEKQGLEE